MRHINLTIELQESSHLYKLHIGCCNVGLISWGWRAWLQAHKKSIAQQAFWVFTKDSRSTLNGRYIMRDQPG